MTKGASKTKKTNNKCDKNNRTEFAQEYSIDANIAENNKCSKGNSKSNSKTNKSKKCD